MSAPSLYKRRIDDANVGFILIHFPFILSYFTKYQIFYHE